MHVFLVILLLLPLFYVIYHFNALTFNILYVSFTFLRLVALHLFVGK